MKAAERREALLGLLRESERPLSGTHLAHELGVSRQVIVTDVGMLRAAGHRIVPTARGYLLGDERDTADNDGMAATASGDVTTTVAPRRVSPAVSRRGLVSEGDPNPVAPPRRTRVIKVRHTVEQTSDELFTVLENGGAMLDVSVSHRVYGRLHAELDIETREQALRFLDAMASGKSSPMLLVTSGYHYHTIAAESEAALDRIERALDSKGYLAPLLPHEL